MWVHVLRNAAIPIITHVMAELPGLLIGAFLIERFFSIPGIGREVILAVERSDFPVIKAITVYVAVRDDGRQPAGRPDVQGGRPARAAQMRRHDEHACRAPRDPPYRLAGPLDARLAAPARRRVAMVSLAHRRGIHRDDDAVRHRPRSPGTGRSEIGVNYAPPTFIGPEKHRRRPGRPRPPRPRRRRPPLPQRSPGDST